MSCDSETPNLFTEVLKGEFVSDRLCSDLKEQIESGKLPPGSLIKPVRELMKQYGISYNSVRKALNQLAKEGYIALEQGRGTFVKRSNVPRDLKAQLINNKAIESSFKNIDNSREKNDIGMRNDRSNISIQSIEMDDGLNDEMNDDRSCEFTVNHEERIANKVDSALRRSVCVWVGDDVLGGPDPGLEHALHAFQAAALAAGWSVTLVAASSVEKGSPPLAPFGAIWGPIDALRLKTFAAPRACLAVGFWPPEGVFSAVVPENFWGASELARRMVRAGHRQFAFLHAGARGRGSACDERWAGLRVALQEAGWDLSPEMALACPPNADWLADRVLSLKPRPTALLVSEQSMAERLIVQLKERGVGVPHAVSVACFGARDEPNPFDIASARVDWSVAGTRAMSRLRELWAGGAVERVRISLPVEIHVGSTVGCPAV